MASVFKPVITRWTGPDGKRCKPNAPGATKTTTEATKWYGRNIPGQSKPVPLATDRRVAEAMLADMVLAYERGAAGLAPLPDKSRTVSGWITGWDESLKSRGMPERDRVQKVSRVRKLVKGAKWVNPADITPDSCESWLTAWCREDDVGPQTRNFYLDHVKSFCSWLVEQGVLPRNPLKRLRNLPVQTDVRRARRALTPTELGRLLEVTRASQHVTVRMDGISRYYLYQLAASSGLRRGELSRLTPAHFHLEDSPPVVAVPGKHAKNRRSVRQPIPSEVAAELAPWLAGKPQTMPVWASIESRAHHALKIDLKAAGIPYRIETPDGPLYADFHALRHTYVSRLEHAGVSLKQAMQLARHSDPRLTLARYGRAQLEELGECVERLQSTADGGLSHLEQLTAILACYRMVAVTLLGGIDPLNLVATAVAPVVAAVLDSEGTTEDRTEPKAKRDRAA